LNHKWGAKNLFFNPNTPAGPDTPQRIDNQYGGTFGGPIKRDRLFFFASWEGTTTAERGNALRSVPTPEIRNGIFGNRTTVYDPLTGDPDGRNRQPFMGNVIPQNRWSPAARTLLDLVPMPNQLGELNNLFVSVPYYFKRDMVDGKLNWTPSSRINVFGKYSVMIAPVTAGASLGPALGDYPGGSAGSAGLGTGNNKTDVFGGGISYVITPTILFDANFGGTLMHHDTTGPDYGTNIGLDVLKIPGTNGPDIRQSGFPIFDITGYTIMGNSNNWSPVDRNDRVYTYAANLNWTKGAHNIRFGIDLIKHELNHWQPESGSWSPRGRFNFRPGVTGLSGGAAANNFNAFASFLLGIPAEMGKAYQFYDPMSTRELQQGYYIRDNWQVTRRLSLNLGMRFEHFPIMDRGEFGIERYDPVTNKVLIGGRGNVPRNAGTEAIKVMYAPRVGFAYRLGDKTVLRAGFGITNDPYPMGRPLRSPFPAVIIDEYIQPNGFSPAIPGASLSSGIPAVRFPDISSGIVDIPNTISTNSLQEGKYRRGYIESFNFTIQRELPGAFVLQTSYVGTRSIRQGVSYFNANAGMIPGAGVAGRPLFRAFGVTTTRQFYIPMAMNRYDAWQSNVTRRFTSGLAMTASYTWSKTIGINNLGTGGNVDGGSNSDSGLDFYVPSQFSKNRAVADFDRTHSFVSAAQYELPFGKGKRFATAGPAALIAGGWQINPSLSIYSGAPFNVESDGASLNAPNNTQVADQVKEEVTKFGGVGPGTPYYDTSAFRAVNEPRFGNTGLNILRGPRRFNMNLGLHRSFAASERWNIQFRAEAVNITNTPALNNPNLLVTTPSSFLQVTAAQQTQRQIRFGLRFAF
jgi:hypothetical protein